MDIPTGNRTDLDRKIVSDQVAFIFELLIHVILSGIVSSIGIITNVINIIVFVKQDAHKEHGIVNLLGLAVADWLLVTNGLYKSVCFVIKVIDPPNITWDPFDLMYLTAGWPHLMYAQISRAITAYIAFERCICVVLPFRVKSIFTPKRSILIVASLAVGIGVSYSPVFIMNKLKYRIDPVTNISKLVLVTALDGLYVTNIFWYINSVLFNQGSVSLVLVCTVITVSRVRFSKTWRDSVTAGNKTSNQEVTQSKQAIMLPSSKMHKEKRLISMITFISVIFIVCFIPDFTCTLTYAIEPEIRVRGTYKNLAMVMYSFAYFMETLGSSINILVYYRMSSRYKLIFRQLMGLDAGNN